MEVDSWCSLCVQFYTYHLSLFLCGREDGYIPHPCCLLALFRDIALIAGGITVCCYQTCHQHQTYQPQWTLVLVPPYLLWRENEGYYLRQCGSLSCAPCGVLLPTCFAMPVRELHPLYSDLTTHFNMAFKPFFHFLELAKDSICLLHVLRGTSV